jgi:hypothetical protein
MLQSDSAAVYASAWHIGNESLWTVVNRGSNDTSGAQIRVEGSDTRSYYDCYRGAKLVVSSQEVEFDIEAGGLGCVFATPNATLAADATALLATMRALTSSQKINSYSKAWRALQQTMLPIPCTTPNPSAPEGMVLIPAVENFLFIATGVEIEGQTSTPMARSNSVYIDDYASLSTTTFHKTQTLCSVSFAEQSDHFDGTLFNSTLQRQLRRHRRGRAVSVGESFDPASQASNGDPEVLSG